MYEGHTIRIEIIDKLYTGASIEVDTADGGVWYHDDSNVLERSHIQTRTARATLLVPAADQAFEDLAIDIVSSDEGRFLLATYHDTVREFVGVIQVDQNSRERSASAYITYTIAAVDGMTLLQSKPYLAAQGYDYVLQVSDGRIRVQPSLALATIAATGMGQKTNLWASILSNEGNKFDQVTGRWQPSRGIYEVAVYVSLIATYTGAAPGDLTVSLNRSSGAGATVVRTKTTSIAASGRRYTFQINVPAINMQGTDYLYVQLSWDFDKSVTLKLDTYSFFETRSDESADVKNVYGFITDHIRDLMSQIPTYDQYGSGDEMVGIHVPWQGDDQPGGVRTEDWLSIPYNAFATDVTASPPAVLSAYEALKQIALQCRGYWRYRAGHYELVPYDQVTTRHAYTRDMTYIETRSMSLLSDPTCIGKHLETYLPPVGEARVTFDRLGSLNLLAGALGRIKQLGHTHTRYVEVQGVGLNLLINVTLLGEEIGSANYAALTAPGVSVHRHIFEISLRLGDYLYVYDASDPSAALFDVVYSLPEWTPTDQKAVLLSMPRFDPAVGSEIFVAWTLPELTFSGELEFYLRYKETVTNLGTIILPEIPRYTVRRALLRKIGDEGEDGLYTESVVASVTNSANSLLVEERIIASDLYEIEQDTGGLRAWDGSALVHPGTFQGKSLQLQIARWIAARQQRGTRILNGGFRAFGISNMDLSYDGLVWVYLAGRYSPVTGTLEGQWIELMPDDIADRFDERVYVQVSSDDDRTRSINTLSAAPTISSSSTSSEAPVTYTHFVTGITTDLIVIPADKPLPVRGLSDEAYMRVFAGSKVGSANLIYRDALTHASHMRMHEDAQTIQIGRPMRATDEIFIIWTI